MATVSTNPMNLGGPRATIDDLYRVDGKAELIDGRIVRYMPTGDLPSEVGLEIVVSLRDHTKRTGSGNARPDKVGYALRRPLKNGRLSFSPDASYYDGPQPANRMRFIEGAPAFAVEVRKGDYTAAAEREIVAKRADYFEAGTQVVWDVDPIGKTVASYRAIAPTHPTVFHSGDLADAEPAVPGWKIAVSSLFSR